MKKTSQPTWLKWPLIAALVIVAFVAYFPSFSGEFILDDVYQIVENGTIQSWSELGPFLLKTNRPVIFASLALNYAVGGLDQTGYHVVNLLIHIGAGLALFGIVGRTLRLPRLSKRFGNSAEWLAFAIALIWLVHPLQTQSVTYIIQRCESMMGLFYLLSLYCLIRGSQGSRGWPWYAAGVAAIWLGMGCKEVMVTAAVVLPLFDRIFLAASWREVVRRRGGFYLFGFVPAVAWLLYAISQMSADTNAGFGYDRIGPLQYLCSQPLVLFHYLRLSILPDRLCLDYGWKPVEHWWQFVPAGLAILAAFIASAVAVVRYRSPLGFVGMAFFLILAPTSSIMPIADLAFEHRMYLPLACVITLLVIGVYWAANGFVTSPKGRMVALASAATLVVAVLVTRTFVRNKMYTVPLALWKNVLEAAPDNVRAHINYGHHLAKNGHFDEAIEHHFTALELSPNDVLAHDNVARMLAYRNRPDEALEHFERVRELRPKWGSAYYHIGILLLRKGEVDEALVNLHQADRIKPNHPGCHYRLGVAYKQKGDYEQALKYLRSADRLRPDQLKTWLAVAEILSLQGKFDLAEERFARCLELDPKSVEAHTLLADNFARADRIQDAIAYYQAALELKPDYEPAKTQLAKLQADAGPGEKTGGTESAAAAGVESASLSATGTPGAS